LKRRPGSRFIESAGGLYYLRKQYKSGWNVLLYQRLQLAGPGVFHVGEHHRDKICRVILWLKILLKKRGFAILNDKEHSVVLT
jgi:hypothetical protein